MHPIILTAITAPTPAHVGISGTIGVDRDWVALGVQLGLLGATLGLAIFTALLFRSTAKVAEKTGELATKTNDVALQTAALAKDTVDASRWADRHHQEQFSPIVVWDVTRCEYILASGGGGSGIPRLDIDGALRNIGGGPALNIKAFVSMGGYETNPNEPIQLGFLGASETREVCRARITDDPRLGAFGTVSRTFGPYTITLWAWSQFGTMVESKMICTDIARRPEALFTPTKIQPRTLQE